MRLLGRRAECEALDRLLTDALAGHSHAIVLRGEAGVGKSALLDYVTGRVDGWHVATAVGVESEMDMAYSGLHQLCGPLLQHLGRLPVPQGEALATVFGRTAGPAPDRFLVGLATLTLLAEVAEQQPLVAIIDDVQWLDDASVQLLGFVARRLLAERVALVCAARVGIGDDILTGLPEVVVRGLGDGDARALLLKNIHGPLDAAVCDRIIAESHGNPLALLELPRTWNATELAGGFALPDAQPVAGRVERSYAERILVLAADTQRLLLAAAAEPLGDPVLLHRAARTLGLAMEAARPAEDAGLLAVNARVEFAHPLVRSAAYRSATATERQAIHRALAAATDPELDPDRGAWHRARATSGPDEAVAAELERSASRAQARGGRAAAAAFLQRSAELTPEPATRAARALAAARAKSAAGNIDAAGVLLTLADAGPLDDLAQAHVQRLRAELAFDLRRGRDAPPMLLEAARRFEALDPALACETYIEALVGSLYAGRYAIGDDIGAISRAALAAPLGVGPTAAKQLILAGLATRFTQGYATAAPMLKQALTRYRREATQLEWSCLAFNVAAMDLWDDEAWFELVSGQARLARATGTLSFMAFAFSYLAGYHILAGDLVQATGLLAESQRLDVDTGSREKNLPYISLQLAAWRGDETAALSFADTLTRGAAERGEGAATTVAEYCIAVLYNGLGRYDLARESSRQATRADEISTSSWALWELVEAAARGGSPDVASAALERLVERTSASGTDWAQGIEARSRALLAEGKAADELHLEAIERLGRCRIATYRARAQLSYGEWLRREKRRVDARDQLRRAYEALTSMGAAGYAERARRELTATGETVRKRRSETRDDLTPQEEQIARLARDGLSNPEIGAQLFISARTVEWHLRKVFAKLGINSRRGLHTVLPRGERESSLV